jgi:hypothetical protein
MLRYSLCLTLTLTLTAVGSGQTLSSTIISAKKNFAAPDATTHGRVVA